MRSCFFLIAFFVTSTLQAIQLYPGSVLLSRNSDEQRNTTPGYWNHVAIVTVKSDLIESHVAKGGVVRTSLTEYLARPYNNIIALNPRDKTEGLRVSQRCEQLVGLPFRKLSSVFCYDTPRRQQLGLNCVSAVRVGYAAEHGSWWRVNIPDEMLRFVGSDFEPPLTIRYTP